VDESVSPEVIDPLFVSEPETSDDYVEFRWSWERHEESGFVPVRTSNEIGKESGCTLDERSL
jgi:hypothetical protein